MSAAALTPRVRIMAVCDDVTASETEEGVFTLEGVRQHLFANTVPCSYPLNLFLLLSSSRKGTYRGKVLLIQESTDRTIRYVKFAVTFEEDNEVVPLSVEIGSCDFPEPGQYSFQVWFSSGSGGDALKGEQPFYVLQIEE